ncbi:TIGR00341 family protein [Flammeovirga sp. MY04]|uniref:TIGR00341 family protein n=1 Tax=Flammeovirga sp. MY04 TaxID=1191459 RepID=UPI000806310A|nr:TIGR00341 family protein [Flammeovirga sp. MY04]ANQ51254.1 TIGR00341 family protein [Flammeovirga sp. MY04]
MSENNLNGFVNAFRKLAVDTLSIREGSDPAATIEGIKKDMTFKGPGAWILIFSILIASIGLNANSTAVIIGAMLISPLMGPILAIGTAIGINDLEMMRRALKNLMIAVVISLITSTIYFYLTPLNVEQSELLARTKPTILDVFVAILGGFSGIIAGSRREKTNVIPGVAIATALMPPLCTAGFGLANGMYHYFFGAFYLFFINSVFITLSTYIVVKFLRFPVKSFIDRRKYRRYQFFFAVFIAVVIMPSAVIFYQMIQETRFKISSEKFIRENTEFKGSELITQKIIYTDSLSTIDLYYMGNPISEDMEIFLNDKIKSYGLTANIDDYFPMTRKTVVKIHQQNIGSDFDEGDASKMMEAYTKDLHIQLLKDIYTKNEKVIEDKDAKIKILEKEIFHLTQSKGDTLPIHQISKEVKTLYPEISSYGISKVQVQEWKADSLMMKEKPICFVKLPRRLPKKRSTYLNDFEKWIRVRLDNKDIDVKEI